MPGPAARRPGSRPDPHFGPKVLCRQWFSTFSGHFGALFGGAGPAAGPIYLFIYLLIFANFGPKTPVLGGWPAPRAIYFPLTLISLFPLILLIPLIFLRAPGGPGRGPAGAQGHLFFIVARMPGPAARRPGSRPDPHFCTKVLCRPVSYTHLTLPPKA